MSVYTVYGLRVRGTADVRYIGQTNNLLELRLIGHHRTARRMPRPTKFADWLKSHGGDVEIFSIHICTTRAEAVAKELGKIADCSPDAIYAGTNGENLLSLDSVALLCEAFPDECAQIVVLFCGGNAPAPTVSDRLARIERELDAIRREAA